MKISVPEDDTAAGFLDFAKRYLRAAEHIPPADAELLHPRCHLYGHAAELALKGFLARRGAKAPKGADGHDLAQLSDSAQKLGLILTEAQRENVVPNLNRIYFERATGERYGSRYPLPGTQVWLTPTPPWTAEFIRSIIEQATVPSR